MIFWPINFVTGIISILGLNFSLNINNKKRKIIISSIFILLIIGEAYDLLGNIALNKIIELLPDTLELIACVGFYILVYYLYLNQEKLIKKKKQKKKEKQKKKKKQKKKRE